LLVTEHGRSIATIHPVETSADIDWAHSVEAAADVLRPEITLPAAVRWVRRRLTPVRRALVAIVTLVPDLFTGDARLAAVRLALATPLALVALRTHAAPHLATLPTPLGFHPRSCGYH
jgi:hypothetical protein